MATNYKWFFDLEEYTMTKDVKEDYIAKVKTIKSFTIEGIADAIAAERTEYRPETIVNICVCHRHRPVITAITGR